MTTNVLRTGLAVGVSLIVLACGAGGSDPASEATADATSNPSDAVAPDISAFVETCAQEAAGAGEDRLARSEAFLACTGRQDGVETTESGLQYRLVTAGEAGSPTPTRGQWVCVDYRGVLISGLEFDSSYARGEPASFPSDRLISGWVEALAEMRAGEARELFIHPDLAYGVRGAGADIGPNEALVFHVTLRKLLEGRADACP